MSTRPITFLSDYGTNDEFAGVCRSAAVLAEAVAFAPAGVHLAVVDPGVGGERRAVAVASNDGGRLEPVSAGIEPGLRLTAEGEPLFFVDSTGSLALAVNRGDAARHVDIEPGERIALTRM